MRNLIEKVESVLKRMRWKAHFFLKGDKSSDQNNSFGLSSNKTAPSILEMKYFENDIINLIKNIKFRNSENRFRYIWQMIYRKLIRLLTFSFSHADKTRDIYETSLDTYNKLMHDNITKTYKHGSEGTISQINDELKDISNNLGIGDRIKKNEKTRSIYFAQRPCIKKISKRTQDVD